LSEAIPSCKMNEDVLMITILMKVLAWGGASSGNSLMPSTHIPNSRPSQTRINPDELDL
jgi:hypothetical protein